MCNILTFKTYQVKLKSVKNIIYYVKFKICINVHTHHLNITHPKYQMKLIFRNCPEIFVLENALVLEHFPNILQTYIWVCQLINFLIFHDLIGLFL